MWSLFPIKVSTLAKPPPFTWRSFEEGERIQRGEAFQPDKGEWVPAVKVKGLGFRGKGGRDGKMKNRNV